MKARKKIYQTQQMLLKMTEIKSIKCLNKSTGNFPNLKKKKNQKNKEKSKKETGVLWWMSIIPATWEAGARWWQVWGHPGHLVRSCPKHKREKETENDGEKKTKAKLRSQYDSPKTRTDGIPQKLRNNIKENLPKVSF